MPLSPISSCSEKVLYIMPNIPSRSNAIEASNGTTWNALVSMPKQSKPKKAILLLLTLFSMAFENEKN